jgi:predicted metalloprotease with PDZ domain
MKYIFLFVLLATSASLRGSVQSPTLFYRLSWDGKSSALKVKLTYSVSDVDSTVFQFGIAAFGGQTDLFNVVSNIQSDQSDVVMLNEKRSRIVVYHKKKGLHELSYQIDGSVNNNNGEQAIYKELFRPVITSGSLYLTPPFFMMFPSENLADNLTIKFESIPKNISFFCSWSPESDPTKEISAPLDKIGEILIVMGSDIKVRKYLVDHNSFYAITNSKDNLDDSSILTPFFSKYFSSLTRYWNDKNKTSYYIYISKLKSTQLALRGGFCWGSGFIMKYFGEFDAKSKYTVGHETSHSWLGKVDFGQNDFEYQWFGEGFNDYVCLINLFTSGIFSQTYLIDLLNEEQFKKHYTSAVNTQPNDSIAKYYWSDREYEKLPYRRGCIFAFYLDNEIRLNSQNKFTLRDMMLSLLSTSKRLGAKGQSMTLDDFIEVASAYLPKDKIADEVNRYMIKGELIDFSKIKINKEFIIEMKNGTPVLSLTSGTDLKKYYNW